jgi:hypothetical protein
MIVLDRIEGDRAILMVGQERMEFPVSALPAGAKEGDVLTFVRDEAATIARSGDGEARLARLRARGPQGPDSMDL